MGLISIGLLSIDGRAFHAILDKFTKRQTKKIVGVTPKQYASRHQSPRFQKNLKTCPSITDAIYSAGYGSSGSAYDKKRDQLAQLCAFYSINGVKCTKLG